MRFEVPQFIEVEDKIFGPLTWRQFVYVGGGAGIATVLFFTTPFLVFVLFGVPIAVLSFLLGFYPVNNQPFSRFLESAVYYFKNNKLYLWRKKNTGVYNEKSIGYSSPSYKLPENEKAGSLAKRLEMKAIQKEQ